jgi:hypothetical protein
MKLDPTGAAIYIASCTDKKQLLQIRANAARHGYSELIVAVNDRIKELDLAERNAALAVRMDGGARCSDG